MPAWSPHSSLSERVAFIVNRKLPPAAALALLAAGCAGATSSRMAVPGLIMQGGSILRNPGFRLASQLGQFSNMNREIGIGNAYCPSANRRQKAN